jgi:hypothetical protein
MKNNVIEANALTMFRALQVWTNAGPHLSKEHAGAEYEKHRRVAEGMTQYLMLEQISPLNLLIIVEPSELVTTDQLLQAYRFHAIKLEPISANSPDKMFFESAVAQSSVINGYCACRNITSTAGPSVTPTSGPTPSPIVGSATPTIARRARGRQRWQ